MLDAFKKQALDRLTRDDRVVGVLVAGSIAEGREDRFSDLDLVVVVSPEHNAAVLDGRREMAAGLGDLLSCFTGEHVGEPRLLICLYSVPNGDRVLHVDIKVVTPDALATRVDEPLVLYDPTGVCRVELDRTTAAWPVRDPQWFEDRVWIWLHYGASRLGRGERLEAHATIGYIREHVLAPMASVAAGLPQRGLRRAETTVPDAMLDSTVCDASATGLWDALKRTAVVYRRLRDANPPAEPARRAEEAVVAYIERLSLELS